MVGARDDPDAGGSDGVRTSATELPRRGSRSGPGQIARARKDLYGQEDTEPTVPAPRDPAPSPSPSPETGWTGDGGAPSPVWPTRAVRDGAPTADPAAPADTDADIDADTAPDAAGAPARPASRRPALLVAAGVVLLAIGLVLGYLFADVTGGPGAVSGVAALPSRPTMLGQVVAVPDGQTASVRVDDQVFDVAVLGLDAPTGDECGAAAATALASTTLAGQFVTLVPDPTVAEFDEQGRRLSYLVLSTQQNYTDTALTAGVARADTVRPLWYSRFFTEEQATARGAGRGLWGPPCDAAR